MRHLAILPTFLAFACGTADPLASDRDTADSVDARIAIAGSVIHMDGPAAGAFVIALDEAGHRMGRAVTDQAGEFALPLPELPAALEIKMYGRTPRFHRADELAPDGPDRFRLDAHLGPMIGGDGTGEALTYMVLETANGPVVVPQIAWGSAGALEPHLDGVAHLLLGARDHRLGSLLPAGVYSFGIEDSVIEHADHLEVQLSAELDAYNLGSAYFAAMVEQIVATVSHNHHRAGLPVRISVACDTCPSGFKPLRDGVLGAAGPGESYYPETRAPDAAFSDTAGHRFAAHMAMAKALGIATGYRDGTNRPETPVTRAELAAMIVSALDLPRASPTSPRFSDVSPSYWAYRAIETVAAKGIISGGADGRFRPTDFVTRAELASYLGNAARWPSVTPVGPSFSDVPATYWAYRRIELAFGWCQSVGPRSWQDGLFQPAAWTTRAEAIVGSVRMMGCAVGNELR